MGTRTRQTSVLIQLLSSRCSAPSSVFLWPSPWSCSSRCPLPRVPLPSLAPLEGLRSPSQLHRPPPLLRLLSSASSSSSLAPTCSAGEERGLQRRRCPPLRPLPPLRLRTATRGSSALPALAK